MISASLMPSSISLCDISLDINRLNADLFRFFSEYVKRREKSPSNSNKCMYFTFLTAIFGLHLQSICFFPHTAHSAIVNLRYSLPQSIHKELQNLPSGLFLQITHVSGKTSSLIKSIIFIYFKNLTQSRISLGSSVVVDHCFCNLLVTHKNDHILRTRNSCIKKVSCQKLRRIFV